MAFWRGRGGVGEQQVRRLRIAIDEANRNAPLGMTEIRQS
jgi:hypothetical protein